MKNILYFTMALLLLGQWAQAQSKRPLSHDVYDSWKSVNAEAISQDGQWVIYQLNPQEGDPQLYLKDIRKKEDKTKSFVRASQASLSADSKFLVFKISPPLDSIKQLRRQKVKKENLPKDTLAIFALSGDSLFKIPHIISFKVPEKEGSAVAYLLAPEKKSKENSKKPIADSTQKDSTQLQKPTEEKVPINTKPDSLEEAQQLIEALKAQLAAEANKNKPKEKEKPKAKAPKVENEKNGYRLVLRDLLSARQDTFLYVTQYLFDEKGTKLAFVSSGKDSLQFTAGVYVYDLNKKALQQVLNLPGKHQNLAWDEAGTQLAFVSDTDTTKANEKALVRYFDLYYWQEKQKIATKLAEKDSPGLPKDWLISEHSSPRFAKDGSKLYFGTQTPPIIKDTLLLPEEIVSVDVWHWQDARLQSQQNVELERTRKKSYWAVAYPKSRRLVQLGSPEIPNIQLAVEGNAEFAIGLASEPYESNMSWEGYPAYQDVYYISFKDGSKQKIKEKLRANVRISPDGQYLYWYAVQDTSWYSYSLKTRQSFNLTKRVNNRFYNEFHDYPDAPREYGEAGWLEKDSHLLLYDRFDIWKFQPEMREAPVRLTNNGRENGLSYRYINLDPDLTYIKSDEPALLYAFDEETKGTGYFSTVLTAPATPRKLLLEEARFSYPQKAKEANRFIFTRESFKDSPDLYYTDQNFTKLNRLSDANPQQSQYLWGTVELVKWTSMDGEELQGLLYKPENFDAGKKYPMITYFYERVTDRMHNYIAPAPSASTIRASEYVSNGYLVFMPDIPYRVGYPGQSAYDAIVSGVTHLLKQPFVDRDRLGIQGQSWGGYQVAYLVTRSNLFAAAMAGAPVANMTSAYGGIRWGTGISRMFQYEHTQSRIGKTLWQDPLLYMENSPLFKADRVETPLLMMHNDADGAVPWYQGIEMYMALKRLNKPVWLLTYNGEDHNLRFRQNRKDLSIRMQQFFDYYLKFAPAPEWMKNGVPAIEKGIRMRYELTKE